MPTYEYKCSNCEYQFELRQSFKDIPKKKCPKCRKLSLEKLLFAPDVIVRLGTSDIKTIGHLADRNTQQMGKYKLDELTEKDPIEQRKKKAKEKAPWWRPGTTGPNKKLAKMNKEEKKRYLGEY